MAMSADMTPIILANIQTLPAHKGASPDHPAAQQGLQPRLYCRKSVILSQMTTLDNQPPHHHIPVL
jgi:hypothetical protein